MMSDELYYLIKDWHEDFPAYLDLTPLSMPEIQSIMPNGAEVRRGQCRCSERWRAATTYFDSMAGITCAGCWTKHLRIDQIKRIG